MLIGCFLLAGAVAHAQQAPPPAPAAGSPATHRSGAELMEALKKALSPNGGATTAAVSNTDQYRINIVHRVKPAGALAHAGNTELHYILEGSGTIVTGGTLVRPAAGAAGGASIENGVARRVTKGDVVIVPENSPHWYKDIDGQITYLEVRWLAPGK
jgi:mannose-6-phosphate isomerase-like protein (cupin superfamily)